MKPSIGAHAQTPYRPDIDGLRTIAVMAVVLHHLWPGLLPGGFIGVDVFFVISGYLITSQIQREIKLGEFSLKQFYKRRINRIVPALLTVVCISVLVGLLVLSPTDLNRMLASAVLALVGFSNIYFWREYGNYFASDTAEAILLHTWSLGVEEQYYAVWPLLLILLSRLPSRAAIAAVWVLIAGSTVGSQYASTLFASASYYLLPTRFFELTIGSVLALHVASRDTKPPAVTALAAMGSGLVLIAIALGWLDKTSTFPGFNALLPTLGAVALIYGGAHHANRLLSARPMVAIGRISYSLYLWHWPLIAYFNYIDQAISQATGGLILAAALLLSWLTWKYIEVPMRLSGAGKPFASILLARLLAPGLVLLAATVLVARHDGWSTRFDPAVARLENSSAQRPEAMRNRCHVPTALYQRELDANCRLGAKKTELDGLLIGDSYANHFSGTIDVMASAEDLAFADYTMNGCPPILSDPALSTDPQRHRCALRNENALALIESRRFAYVALAANWPIEETTGALLEATIHRIQRTGARVVVLMSNATIPKGAVCPVRHMMQGVDPSCAAPRVPRPMYWQSLVQRLPEVRFIDPDTVICGTHLCHPMLNGILLYRDSGHLNDVGARLIGQELITRGTSLTGRQHANHRANAG